MHIQFVEIQNFRKLKSVRIDFAKDTTLFVGANNSGKTSAIEALRCFLIDKKSFTTKDITLSNWRKINQLGIDWESTVNLPTAQIPTLNEWASLLPSMDVWLHVAQNEIHHVNHLLPTLTWAGGLLGVRIRLEPNIEKLHKEYLLERKAAKKILQGVEGQAAVSLNLWPINLCEFLEKRLKGLFEVRAYTLDPLKCNNPLKGIANPQSLPDDAECLEGDPFRGLIRIDVIAAQRGFSDVDNNGSDSEQTRNRGGQKMLSGQLRDYYNRHLDPSELPESSDIIALQAIESAQASFDTKLKTSFDSALKELEGLGYPGVTDPKLIISTKIQPMDGLTHSSAVQFEVTSRNEEPQEKPLCLPEQYNGLGYQNLISMVFKLMSFRDAWMQVGKAAKKAAMVETNESYTLPRLHLVLVEEPEAHLHAQVQQVFIRKAYKILRNHAELGETPNFMTQMLISTHSSHIAHECDFSSLRYFRRKPVQGFGEVPISTVVNLSEVFGGGDNTQRFVARYLKTTHCDLFFADAAILVEGPAERMLLPHFIRNHFEELNQGYITVLEIGGSHAHRLKPLIEHLQLTTLIVADLDAMDNKKPWKASQPKRGKAMVTRNFVLRGWVPERKKIDELLDLAEISKIKTEDALFSVRVAYQCPVSVQFNGIVQEALSNTFEDALVFDNLDLFRTLKGTGLIKKIREAVNSSTQTDVLGQKIFDLLQNGDKAELALNLLGLEQNDILKVPTYIQQGLSWLQEQLRRKQTDILLTP